MSNRSGVATSRTAAPRLRADHVRRLIDAAQDSHSASTRRNYLAAWRRFQLRAEGEGFHPIPGVIMYLTQDRGVGSMDRHERETTTSAVAPHTLGWTELHPGTDRNRGNLRRREAVVGVV